MASRAVQHFIEILKDAKEILFVIPTSGLQRVSKCKKPEEMRKIWLFLVLVTLVAFSCSDDSDSTPCSFSDNPESSNLVWLTNEIQEMSENVWMYQFQYVTRARYGPKLVFLFRNCCPNCFSLVPVYDCAGTLLGIVGGDIQASLIKNEEVFWKPENSACSLN